MVTEIAEFNVKTEHHALFGDALKVGVNTVLSKADGYLAHQILASQETPGRFVLLVEWTSTEAHTIGFRQSEAFAEWRSIIGPYFERAPLVEHFDTVEAHRNG